MERQTDTWWNTEKTILQKKKERERERWVKPEQKQTECKSNTKKRHSEQPAKNRDRVSFMPAYSKLSDQTSLSN